MKDEKNSIGQITIRAKVKKYGIARNQNSLAVHKQYPFIVD